MVILKVWTIKTLGIQYKLFKKKDQIVENFFNLDEINLNFFFFKYKSKKLKEFYSMQIIQIKNWIFLLGMQMKEI
jgi:hypothetical protein